MKNLYIWGSIYKQCKDKVLQWKSDSFTTNGKNSDSQFDKITRRVKMYTHLGGVLGGYSNKVVLSDRQLDSDRIKTKNKTNYENSPQWKTLPNHKLLRRSKIVMKRLSRLGTRLLPDRRICFAGKLLRGILMPRNHFLQILILKRNISIYQLYNYLE